MSKSVISDIQTLIGNIKLNFLSQGAESVIFESSDHPYIKTHSSDKKVILKYRIKKEYRNSDIDARIIRNRTITEIKFIIKLLRLGIKTPLLILANINDGLIWMDFVGYTLPNGDTSSLKNLIWYIEKNNSSNYIDLKLLFYEFGQTILKLHLNDLIHGDLTTSNIIIHNNYPYLIDFGLSSCSKLAEEKAVDLYVLEKAIVSTHSNMSDNLLLWFYEGYDDFKSDLIKKKISDIKKKLTVVKSRGRKKSMVG